MEHSPMLAASRTQRQDYEDGLQHAPVHFLEHCHRSPQPYSESGLEPDLGMQSHIEVVHSNRGLQPHAEEPHSNMGLQPEKTPSQKTSRQARGFRRTSFLLVALVVAVVIATVLGGALGSLIRKEKTDSKASSEDDSKIENATVTVTRATSISQGSASNATTPSSSFFSPSKSSPVITLGPSETYSIISSPTLTISRDCPRSNGTTIITNDVPQQSFIKNCNWLYNIQESSGDAFESVTTTLDACISLCAAYNVINGTGPLGYCTSVEWRPDLNEDCAGCCYGNFDQKAGVGEPAIGGKVVPVDAAYFLGWS